MKKAALIIALFLVSSLSYAQIDFQKGTVAEVLAKAKAENKIVMVDVMTDWCKWCIELDNKVYAKKEVSDFANANQVNYKIDAEKGEGVDFAKKYKIQGFPSILFLDGDGNEIDRVYGYVPAKDFLEMMTDYNKGINTYSYLQAEVEKNPSNIDASLKLADKYSMYSENDKAKVLLNKIIEMDGSNAGGKTDDAKFRLILFEEKDAKAKALETFIAENPNSDQLKDAYVSVSETYYYELSDLPSAEKWFKETLAKYSGEESVKSSYGQFLNQKAAGFADKGTSDEDYKKGLGFIDEALPYVAGSVNEASSYYIQSKLLYNLKDYSKAMESVDKALKIFDRKLYRDHKTKIEQQLSQK